MYTQPAQDLQIQPLACGVFLAAKSTTSGTVQIGLAIEHGVRDDPSEWNGLSHIVEHALVAELEQRLSPEVSRFKLSGYTSAELILVRVECLAADANTAIEHLSAAFNELDTISESLLTREAARIAAETSLLQDSRAEFDHLHQQVYRGHPLARPLYPAPLEVGVDAELRIAIKQLVNRAPVYLLVQGPQATCATSQFVMENIGERFVAREKHNNPRQQPMFAQEYKTWSENKTANRIMLALPTAGWLSSSRRGDELLHFLLFGSAHSIGSRHLRHAYPWLYSCHSISCRYQDSTLVILKAESQRSQSTLTHALQATLTHLLDDSLSSQQNFEHLMSHVDQQNAIDSASGRADFSEMLNAVRRRAAAGEGNAPELENLISLQRRARRRLLRLLDLLSRD